MDSGFGYILAEMAMLAALVILGIYIVFTDEVDDMNSKNREDAGEKIKDEPRITEQMGEAAFTIELYDSPEYMEEIHIFAPSEIDFEEKKEAKQEEITV